MSTAEQARCWHFLTGIADYRGFESPATRTQARREPSGFRAQHAGSAFAAKWWLAGEVATPKYRAESEALAAFVDVNDDILTQAADQAFVPREPLTLIHHLLGFRCRRKPPSA